MEYALERNAAPRQDIDLMNLPNKLTLLRVILIPFFIAAMYLSQIPGNRFLACGIFALASITDALDGYIARKYNLITDFGKFMDPLADKLLVCSAILIFVDFHLLPGVAAIVIIAREFIISGFRLAALQKGRVIAAGWLGKIKTVLQMFMCFAMILDLPWSFWAYVRLTLMILAVAFTVISLVDYIFKNTDVLKEVK